jgi:ABC-type spermidine/putrescine transport system permease subunit II
MRDACVAIERSQRHSIDLSSLVPMVLAHVSNGLGMRDLCVAIARSQGYSTVFSSPIPMALALVIGGL